jgi:hypothetical protein
MEYFVLYIPELEKQFKSKEEFKRHIMCLLSAEVNPSRKVIYKSEEQKLYLTSVSFGMMKFQSVSIDFTHNTIAFKKMMDDPVDMNLGLYNLLSTLQVEFFPKRMSYVMERPATHSKRKQHKES